VKFEKISEDELNAMGAQMPVGYSAKIRCICGKYFLSPGIGYCPYCNAGMVVVPSGDGRNYHPVARVPDGSNISNVHPPVLEKWVRQ
jgi:hypothetical protein